MLEAFRSSDTLTKVHDAKENLIPTSYQVATNILFRRLLFL